eukprot:3805335-Pleurochrysis_carterae.AAC.1
MGSVDRPPPRRLKVEALIKASAPNSEIRKMPAFQMAHIQDMHAERQVTAAMCNEARRPSELVFTVDDKLGSHWRFLPIPP